MSLKPIEEPALDDVLAGVPVVLAPTATGVRVGGGVGFAIGAGARVAVGTGVGVGIGVDVAVGVALGMGVGSDSSAVPQAAMSGSRAVSRMAMVVIVVVRMFPMVLEWRLASNFTSMNKMPLILVSI